jgi:hypothetical protein
MLRKLDASEAFAPSYSYPVYAWRLGGETLFIGPGAEAVVDHALRFKREYGPGTWVCGYVDDMIAYIPSRRVWGEGAKRADRTSTSTAGPPPAGRATSMAGSPPRSSGS